MQYTILLALTATAAAVAGEFEHERKATDLRGGEVAVQVRDVTFANLSGGRTGAYVVSPPGKQRGPGVLFVHWYEPPSQNSNRTQFLGEAIELAKRGATSLLIETMWSEPEWFPKRNRDQDYRASVQQVKELRRALDVLLADRRVDPKRVAYVGHDFGAMYGALLASADQRPAVYALQAGTTSFSDWFLFGPKMEEEARKKFVEQLAPLDPVKHIGAAEGRPILLQFGKKDRFVTVEKGEQFFTAAREPKQILWYDAPHSLNEQAVKDRLAWLIRNLGLR